KEKAYSSGLFHPFLLDTPDHPTRIAGGKYVIGNVFGHHTSRTDHAAVAYGHARTNHRTSPDPNILPYSYRLGIFQSGGPFYRINGVGGGINLYIRTKKRPTSDFHLRHIQHYTVEVEKNLFPYQHIIAIITIKRRLHPKSFPGLRDQRLQYPHPLFQIGRAHV